MSNPQNYTVGWICAIRTEYVAAQALLDEKHEGLEHVYPNDNNDYTLGRVGKHNVVIAVAPDGEYGTSSAANVARDLMRSFPNVRIGLMVGIGGGVPSQKHDIRLGDVVVSSPSNGKGGVFQYDIGKVRQDQGFQSTGFLNQPPPVLRTAVAGLRAKYESDGHQLEAIVNAALEKKPRLQKKYGLPDPSTDRLYLSEVAHPLNDERDCIEACNQNSAKIIFRAPRTQNEDNPTIHYGLIASANQLIRDAKIRDVAARQDILCFEMEAAGLMNHFPCLVIRGICDYSDSHKNKLWQGYASIVAAAYAKELLYRILPSKVENERKILDTISDALIDVQEGVDNLVHVQRNQEYNAILEWLTPIEYTSQQNDYAKRRQPGTGQWILDSVEYQTWLETGKQTLFCPGIPGAGKTMIAAIVVNDLATRFHDNTNIGIAYLYCNFRRSEVQSAEDLLASLLKQLSQTRYFLPESVEDIYYQHETRRTRPSQDEISISLQSVIATYSRVFIVVDALDECRKSLAWKLLGANLFITSRFIMDITERFKGKLTLEVRASGDDVREYLDGHMFRLPGFVGRDRHLQEQISNTIVQSVNGMFLLAELRLESLIGKRSPRAVRQALKLLQNDPSHLRTESEVYDMAYMDTMERIHGQTLDQMKLASDVLSWIVCAKRPLTTSELQHALAVEPGDSDLHEDGLPAIEDMVSVCAGLVTVDEESDVIRLVHYTTHEFFERTQNHWFPGAESNITTICVTYLSFNVFSTGICRTDDEFEKRLQSNRLYDYASKHWGYHVCGVLADCRGVMKFLDNRALVEASSQALMTTKSYKRYSLRFPRKITGLHLAAYFGAKEVVNSLLNMQVEFDSKDASGQTPLSWAAERGHEEVVWLLLSTGKVESDSKDDYGRTPLSWAAERGHEAVVQQLLATGQVEPDWKDTEYGRTPLWYAAGRGHEGVVRLLLETGQVDPESKDNYGQTPLSWAAGGGHMAVVKLLSDTSRSIIDSVDQTRPRQLELIAPYGYAREIHDSYHNRAPPAPPTNPQNFGLGAPEGYTFQYSSCTGRRKALLIGINYFGQRGQLRACTSTVKHMATYINQHFDYAREDILILTDDDQNRMSQPTKSNILRAMHWLVKDAQPNDALFFHYCGHGGQSEDLDGDQEDGYNELIYPVDFRSHGHIMDDEMHRIMVKSLPSAVRLTAIFDSSNSGSALDLPYIYSTSGVLKEPNLAKEAGHGLLSILSSYASGDVGGMASAPMGLFKKTVPANRISKNAKTNSGDVIMWSAQGRNTGCHKIGAMSLAIIAALEKNQNQSYVQLLNSIRDELATKNSQRPQLSCSHPLIQDIAKLASARKTL